MNTSTARKPRRAPSARHAMPAPEDVGGRRVVTVDEAGALLKVGRSSVYAMIKTGTIKPVKIGRSTRIRVADLDALLAQTAA